VTRSGAETFAKLDRPTSPELLERNVGIRELAGRNAQKSCRAARLEVNAHDSGVSARVELERRAVAAGHDRAREAKVWFRRDGDGRAADPELVFRQVDDELDGPAGKDPFARVLGVSLSDHRESMKPLRGGPGLWMRYRMAAVQNFVTPARK
jgi:hypothetical protein